MNKKDISQAKNPDLRSALGALKRSAETARKIAVQTDTELVIVEDGKMVSLSADELRAEALKFGSQ